MAMETPFQLDRSSVLTECRATATLFTLPRSRWKTCQPLGLLEVENQQAIDLLVFPTDRHFLFGESDRIDIILDVNHNF